MKTRTQKVGRDAATGKFISVEWARRRTRTATVETMKIPVRSRKRGRR